MAKPPVNPLGGEKGKSATNYFEMLILWAVEELKTEGIKLQFKGYQETLLDYATLKEDDLAKAWNLARELNAWAEYFSSVANLIQKLYLDSEAEKEEVKANASFTADDKKVANGDRLSNKDPEVVRIRKKRNTLKAFYDELTAKVSFLERAHYHCKATYDGKTRNQATTSTPPSYSNVG